MPPCTSTRLSCSFWRVSRVTSDCERMRWLGNSLPRLIPNSESPSAASTPSISLMPGQIPPESCQPPPDPPSHSPRMARAATSRRSGSARSPVSDATWPVARMHTEMSDASRWVETASREPFGMSLTWLTISMPRPSRPRSRRSRCASGWPELSRPGGTSPEAMTAALSRPR